MDTLRSKLIRLAHQNPEVRPHVLPLLGKTRTAAKHGVSVRAHIEDGLLAIVEAISFELGDAFIESIKFNAPAVTGRLQASVEGTVEWNPDPSQKGYIVISFGVDQFDLSKGELFLHIDLPSGKKIQKAFGAGSDWLAKPALSNGKKFAGVLKMWIEGFFASA
jgi:hypothetical protein